ncbi:MAG: hypothetical protein GY812_14900 [Actinomycetia bacterium]|nr:hypothetical protein [Actinomycetes bacterium]
MNDMTSVNNRRTRRSAFTGPSARPAAVVRRRRVQVGYDEHTGDYRLSIV